MGKGRGYIGTRESGGQLMVRIHRPFAVWGMFSSFQFLMFMKYTCINGPKIAIMMCGMVLLQFDSP